MAGKRPIKQQLLQSHFGVSVVIFAAAMVFFSLFTYRLLLTRFNENTEAQLSAIVSQVELEVGRMDTVLLNLLYSGVVKDNFDVIGVDMTRSLEIMEAMTSINGPRLEVQQINAYTLDGRMVSAGFNNRMMQLDISGRRWYKETLALDGRRYISVPGAGESSMIANGLGNQRYISIYRVFHNRYDKPSGIVEVMRDVRYIFKSVGELYQDGDFPATVAVYDGEGRLVYANNAAAIPVEPERLEGLAAGDKVSFKAVTESGSFRVSAEASESTGWIFLIAMPESVIYQPVLTLLAVMLALLVLTSLFILLISNTLAGRIARPIKQLHSAVAGTTLDNMDKRDWVVESGTVEISELARLFDGMTSQLAKSMADTIKAGQQESEARMLALQAQMNPHFLYNSLTNLSVMAEKGMNDGIVAMCQNMSFMLRYVSSAAEPVVAVSDEMDYVKNYLECMKIRYGRYLHYTIDMDPGTEDITILKLSVQPLVENAIRHGVGEDSIWRIGIRSYFEADGGWRVSVRSDGAAFDPDNLRKLTDKMRELDESGIYPQLSIKGMGLMNLYCRLRLFWGERTVFRLETGTDPDYVEITFGADVEKGGESCE